MWRVYTKVSVSAIHKTIFMSTIAPSVDVELEIGLIRLGD